MGHIFCDKKLSILFVAGTLLLVILVCMLFTTLTQKAAMTERVAVLQSKIDKYKKQGADLTEFIEYLGTNEYVERWAENNGYINLEDINWIQEVKKSR